MNADEIAARAAFREAGCDIDNAVVKKHHNIGWKREQETLCWEAVVNAMTWIHVPSTWSMVFTMQKEEYTINIATGKGYILWPYSMFPNHSMGKAIVKKYELEAGQSYRFADNQMFILHGNSDMTLTTELANGLAAVTRERFDKK